MQTDNKPKEKQKTYTSEEIAQNPILKSIEVWGKLNEAYERNEKPKMEECMKLEAEINDMLKEIPALGEQEIILLLVRDLAIRKEILFLNMERADIGEDCIKEIRIVVDKNYELKQKAQKTEVKEVKPISKFPEIPVGTDRS